jgi:hypothetical protein
MRQENQKAKGKNQKSKIRPATLDQLATAAVRRKRTLIFAFCLLIFDLVL